MRVRYAVVLIGYHHTSHYCTTWRDFSYKKTSTWGSVEKANAHSARGNTAMLSDTSRTITYTPIAIIPLEEP